MFKKTISIFLIFAFIIIMTMAIFAETETPAGPVVKLIKVEGLKNSLGVQKLDIRVNGFSGYKIVKDNNFESVYFEREEVLEVEDITKFKVNVNVLTTCWKWYSSVTSLVAGENVIPLEIKKDRKIFKMIVTVVVEYPENTAETTAETTATPEATATNTDTITSTPVNTGDITPEVTEVTATPTETPKNSDVDEMPDTGETDTAILIIFGIVLVGSSGMFLFLMRLKNAKNN
jgi:LPXTG-motif cell wall-anchored protein